MRLIRRIIGEISNKQDISHINRRTKKAIIITSIILTSFFLTCFFVLIYKNVTSPMLD